MERTIEYLKDLKEDVSLSIQDDYSTTIAVGSNDLEHIVEALEDIERLQKEVHFWKDLAESCECNND
ncbi:MAG: hypothetical protein ABS938_15815 [Psychrobacillus psychrodurans]